MNGGCPTVCPVTISLELDHRHGTITSLTVEGMDGQIIVTSNNDIHKVTCCRNLGGVTLERYVCSGKQPAVRQRQFGSQSVGSSNSTTIWLHMLEEDPPLWKLFTWCLFQASSVKPVLVLSHKSFA